MLNLPHFIVLGGHKCGTTSLHNYLNQHPEIFMFPEKGSDFFNREGNNGAITTVEEYQKLYQSMTFQKCAGEVSSIYLYSERACQTIKRYVPQVKMIIILRNPTERAWSKLTYTLPRNLITSKKVNCIFTDSKYKDILEYGLYSKYIEMYFSYFSREQIRIFLFDDLRSNQQELFSSIFKFLEVDSTFVPDTSVIYSYGRGGEIKNKYINNVFTNKQNLIRASISMMLRSITTSETREKIYRKLKKIFTIKISMENDLQNKLVDFYKEDIIKLQDLIDRDLSHWLKVK